MSGLNIEAELNGPQLKAVTAIEGPVLIIAGAGSGKTRVITYRIAYMLDKGIPQSAILALTFTNKAAREMETRVKELTGKKLQSLTVSTFHAFGVRILREEIEALGYRKNFSIYDETDRIELIKESLRDCKLSSEGVDLYRLGQIFSNIKIGRLKWGSPDGADTVWEPVYQEYQQSLKIYNALDFDDLLTVPIALFEEHPEILEKYRRRYRYIMVDEFQDTSFIQYRLMRMLALGGGGGGGVTGETRPPNVCVVGDDDQSIYSWRGASYENILLFEMDFPGVEEIKLEQNYRSTTTILEAANGVIANNTNRKDKRLWSGNSGGKPIEIFYPENESEEAAFIAAQIKKIRFEENLRYDDFGVLTRTNNQFECIEEAFLAENIPCKVSGGQSFFERKEVKDTLSYLRVIANPSDDVNLLRIINTPKRGIGKASIGALLELAKKNRSTLWDSLDRFRIAKRLNAEHGQEMLFQEKGKGEKGEIESFISLIETLRESMLGSGELFKKVKAMVEEINYWGYLITEYSKDEKKARWKYANIEYLIRMIETWEKDPDNLDAGLFAYLNRISLLTRTDSDSEAGKGKANLMTIHASKGLEFPVVFIAGAENGIIPHERSIEDHPEDAVKAVEEERRLFYVAITRARDKLYITSCRSRKRRQDTIERVPSPFLAEIPGHLTEYHENEKELAPQSAEKFFARMREKFGN
ncbi:MAG: UvrD-helicase domain-containing protein [Treponema sp.]|nr:UvrD-helicase domain-containing protein [Treponema sp.]